MNINIGSTVNKIAKNREFIMLMYISSGKASLHISSSIKGSFSSSAIK